MKIIIGNSLPSPARVFSTDSSTAQKTDNADNTQERETVRVALLQYAWDPDKDALKAKIAEGISAAATAGAKIVFLPELSLYRYLADTIPDGRPADISEDLYNGETFIFATDAAKKFGVFVGASIYATAESEDGLGLNIAILVSPDGELVGATPKLHIPITAGYYEDKYFRPGPAENPYPVLDVAGIKLGMPTCWDEWFGEVARAYSLQGAEALVYPTAIGSEPDHPEFDTEPLWRQVIIGHGIENALFMIVPNRVGNEGLVTFYGSSFISDPYGRILARASRNEETVLVADLELAQRKDWLDLFPFLRTRRPDTYGIITREVGGDYGGRGELND